MATPFLLRYAKDCQSPGRVPKMSASYFDSDVDMLRASDLPGNPLLIEVPHLVEPKTKKADIEKGEDQKDRRMWR
ncbi:hypothetical protein [Opitutus terrae]|uniref:Uncharacterized protein n=1 Tax=Opitutus terrae (strain DSM 11246 / JCM 15787 / PB90-1) TaxID=452637 RepID=B1ZYJ6_OPITP|nr:hypothetical protein [Opitutus terrae]ACB75232.1 hypothetical protein Oter_1949 [Opitutus terrae PB90-1]